MSAPVVHALVVWDGRGDHLDAVIAAIDAQDRAPEHATLVVPVHVDAPAAWSHDVRRVDADSHAAALAAAIEEGDLGDDDLLWLLHADTAPEPRTLAAQVATMAKRPRAAVVGAAIVRWRDRSRLVSMGTTVSRVGARRIGLVVEDDINQGQHDWREDVLAVSLAGALVRVSAYRAVGGLDEGYRGFGDSLEWCRRAWAAGWDVVVQPRAVVRHAQEGLYGLRRRRASRASTHATRTASSWHHALAWAPWWAVPLLVAWLVPSALGRALTRIVQNSPRIAAAELAVPALVLARAGSIAATARARASLADARPVPGRLFAGARQVLAYLRVTELGAFESARARRVPSELVRRDLAQAAVAHRRAGVVTLLGGLAMAGALAARHVPDLVAGNMLTSPALGATNVTVGQAWEVASTGWSPAGASGPTADAAFAALMIPLLAVPGGVAIALLGGPLWAVAGAWWAAGAATRSPWVRAAAAVVYGAWPPFLSAVVDGRLGPVVAHVFLPLAAVALAHAVGARRGDLLGDGTVHSASGPTPSAGLAAALALTVVTVAQPVLLAPTAVLVAALAVVAHRGRLRVLGALILPVLAGLPGLAAAWERRADPSAALSVMARDPGPVAVSDATFAHTVAGLPDADGWASLLTPLTPLAAATAIVVAAAAAASLLSARATRAVAGGLVVAAAGLGAAAASAGSAASWAAHGARWPGWPGTGSSLMLVGLLAAALAAHGALAGRPERRASVGRTVAAVGALVATAGAVLTVTAHALPAAPQGDLATADSRVLPLALALDRDAPTRQRTVVVTPGADAAGYSLMERDGDTGLLPRPTDPDGAVAMRVIEPALAQALASADADLGALTDWGIGSIVLVDGAPGAAALDTHPQAILVGGSERGATYRLGDGAARAWVDTERGREVVPSDSVGGSVDVSSAGTLIVAVPPAAGWQATLDGASLDAVEDPLGRVAFEVPGPGTVEYRYRDPLLRWWRPAAAVALAWALLGAIPIRRREEMAR